jgi:hypothetical protein
MESPWYAEILGCLAYVSLVFLGVRAFRAVLLHLARRG